MGQNSSFNIHYNFSCNIEDSNLIFGRHVYLMQLQILSGERSNVKVIRQGQKSNIWLQSGTVGGIVFHKHNSYF